MSARALTEGGGEHKKELTWCTVNLESGVEIHSATLGTNTKGKESEINEK